MASEDDEEEDAFHIAEDDTNYSIGDAFNYGRTKEKASISSWKPPWKPSYHTNTVDGNNVNIEPGAEINCGTGGRKIVV